MPEAAARATVCSVIKLPVRLWSLQHYIAANSMNLISSWKFVLCFMWVPHCTNTSLFIEIAFRVCFPVVQQYWEVYQASQLSKCLSGMMYQKGSHRKNILILNILLVPLRVKRALVIHFSTLLTKNLQNHVNQEFNDFTFYLRVWMNLPNHPQYACLKSLQVPAQCQFKEAMTAF